MALVTLPSAPAPSRFTRRASSSAGVSRSPWSLVEQVQQNQGQLWAFSVELPPMSDDQARDWWGAMLGLNGPAGTFLFGDPKWKTPRGDWAGAPVIDGGGQEGQTLALAGFTAAATGRAGDYFQLGADLDTRLYCVTADFVADGGGAAQIEFWPRLRLSPADQESIVTATPKGVFRLATGDVPMSWEPFRNGYSFDIFEALNT